MKKAALTLFIIYFSNIGTGQIVSTNYYNKNWEKTNKRNRYYTRQIIKKNDSLFIVKDFYLIDSLEMTGHLKSIEPVIEDGLFTFYYASGIKHFEGNYCNGVICGEWMVFDKYGNKTDSVNYNFKLKECQAFDTTENAYLKKDSMNYILVDQMPRFASKTYSDFGDYIKKTMFIPPLINKYKLADSVNMNFTVDINGSICNIKVNDDNYELSIAKEAMRILNLSPRWKPALSNGYPVPVDYLMPIKVE